VAGAQGVVRALGWAGWAVHGAGRGNALAGRGAGRIGPGDGWQAKVGPAGLASQGKGALDGFWAGKRH